MDSFEARELYNQARVFMGLQKYEEALKCIDEALEYEQMCTDYHVERGIILANMHKLSEAVKSMENALKVDKSCGEAYFHLGNLYQMEGLKAAAIEKYNKAIISGYNEPQLFFHMALMYEEEGRLDQAVKFYGKVILMDPLRTDARIRKIKIQIGMKAYEDALNSVNELMLIDSDLFEGYHYKASIFSAMGRNDEAMKVLDEGVKNFPKDTKFLLDKVNILTMQNKKEEAKELISSLIANDDLGPTEKRHLELERARIYAAEEKPDEMIESLKAAKEYSKQHNPEDIDPEATFFLASCMLKKEEYDLVLQYSKELQECGNMTYALPAYYYAPRAVFMKEGLDAAKEMYKESISLLRKITLEKPQLQDGYLFRALCHKDIGEFDKSLKLCEYLLKTDSKNSSYINLKAEVLYAMGQEDEAKKLLATAGVR